MHGSSFCPLWERHHDVLAVTLAGHAGGPPIAGEISDVVLADAVERAMDEAGFETAHIVGNSLGGYVALQLASRSRARTVVALAPAGGSAHGDESYARHGELRCGAPLIDHALREGYSLDAEKITCPVRVLWGAEDRLLPLPSAAARFCHDWLPQADWVELDGVGHCPQLDIPLETAQLILGLTSR